MQFDQFLRTYGKALICFNTFYGPPTSNTTNSNTNGFTKYITVYKVRNDIMRWLADDSSMGFFNINFDTYTQSRRFGPIISRVSKQSYLFAITHKRIQERSR